LRVAWLPDGKRLHLQNGLVNLIVQAFGPPAGVGRAYSAGIERARALVLELADDVPRLQAGEAPQSEVGLRAAAACAQVPGALGPLTVLSGAVADEVLAAMVQGERLDRAFVNNHGVVGFHLAEGQSLSPQGMDWPEFARYDATTVAIPAAARTRGIAAGGWHYHGFAFGCVDRIYAASTSGAMAEAVLGSITTRMLPGRALETVPAGTLEPGSVLGALGVYPLQDLAADEVAQAMAQGREAATALFDAGISTLALIELRGKNFLAAPPQFSLRSLLSIQA
jgi:uncharacterized protein